MSKTKIEIIVPSQYNYWFLHLKKDNWEMSSDLFSITRTSGDKKVTIYYDGSIDMKYISVDELDYYIKIARMFAEYLKIELEKC